MKFYYILIEIISFLIKKFKEILINSYYDGYGNTPIKLINGDNWNNGEDQRKSEEEETGNSSFIFFF